MSEKHTQGRLAADGPVVLFSDNAGGFDISACPYPEVNARRLVACWNACEGLPTKVLEHASETGDSLAGHIKLTAQRDELLAALEEVLAAERFSNRPPETVMQAEAKLDRIRKASARAEAAIAKVKGGA